MKLRKILMAAGGTGGHIFPALTVAEELKRNGVEVYWLGSHVGLEKKIIALHYPIYYISIDRIRGKGFVRKFFAPLKIFIAIWQALRVVRLVKPQLVLGMGGFVSGPGGVAAWINRIPLIIHEQNAVAGFTNRVLACIAKKILCGFPNVFSQQFNGIIVGNPVRPAISALPPYSFRIKQRGDKLHVLVLGGSQGAHAINQAILALVREFPEKHQIDIWHQTGETDAGMVTEGYSRLGIPVKLNSFITDMVSAYAWADLVVSRAGAMTVSEIAAAGLVGIFIPLPYAADNHQLYNGCYLEQQGAAIVISQTELTAGRLIEIFNLFLNDRNLLQSMAEKARQLSFPNATQDIIEKCIDVSENN